MRFWNPFQIILSGYRFLLLSEYTLKRVRIKNVYKYKTNCFLRDFENYWSQLFVLFFSLQKQHSYTTWRGASFGDFVFSIRWKIVKLEHLEMGPFTPFSSQVLEHAHPHCVCVCVCVCMCCVCVLFFRALRNVAFFSFFKSNALFVCWSFRPRRLQWSFCAHYVKSSAWTRTHTHCVCVCGCVCMCVCVLSDDGWVSCYEVGDASTMIHRSFMLFWGSYFPTQTQFSLVWIGLQLSFAL